MSKYIYQLRRGWKDDATGRDDWAEYEKQENHIKPLEGELVLEYDNGIPRLKIGDGANEFSQLPYMSADSFVLPKPISITLDPDKWEPMIDENNEVIANTYCQKVTVDNAVITNNSQIDLRPNAIQLLKLSEAGINLVVENDFGTVTVCAVGGIPHADCGPIRATVKEITPI